ncbi:hypothetical protein [Pluralibacter sp.]|uniref:hypothetical protein n=1 Tax=Pluralibacter sp. TaxID=1920032 RepID=UPI0025CC0E4C|nr:hypothetical protein [Pluralibacter sp.]MBV8044567.1 hypothetical protein [Pluralibacter sp.]
MKNKIVLSITVGSMLIAGIVAPVSAEDASHETSNPVNKAPTSSGKCASGKCGTEKIYGQASLNHDPQYQLVRARDGKCGLTGEGINQQASLQQIEDGKCTSGVCGK